MLNPIYFACDFLEFTIPSFSSLNFTKKYNFTFSLDFDNSSQGFIYLEDIKKTLSYRKVNLKNYSDALIFSISIDDVPFDIFYFAKGKINEAKIKTKNKIGFYSSFFILNNIGKLDFEIKDFYKNNFYNKLNKLHRLDICLDVNLSIKDLNFGLFKGVDFYSTLGKDKKYDMFGQTYYIKNPLSRENRFYLIRIYDKLLDTFKKGKNYLYSYLEKYEDVRRIELELRQDSCNMIKEDIENIIFNKDFILEKIFKNYLTKKGNCDIEYFKKILEFKKLGELSLFSNVKKRIDLKEIYGKLKHIPKNYISMGHGYIKKIYEVSGFNGLFQLLFKSQINGDGKKESEKISLGYKLFENLLDYFLKNNLYYNPDIIEKIYKKYKNNIKKFKKTKKNKI